MTEPLALDETPVPDGVCDSCEDAEATTTCGSPAHACALCENCRLMLDGLNYEDDPPTPAEGARQAAAEQPSGTESAPPPLIVPSAGTTFSPATTLE